MPVQEAWLEVTDTGYAKAHSNVTKHTALPFEFQRDGVDGTQLMLQFLGMAEDRGAHYASNIEIIIQLEHNGSTVECVSKVVPEGSEPPPADVTSNDPSGDAIGTTTIHNWHPDLVTAQVDDHDYKCERHATDLAFTQKTANPMEGPYMADQKELFYLNTPASPEVVTADWADTCKLITNHHQVKRYEHFVAAHFQPPDWDKLAKVFADRKLVELPAECHSIAARSHHLQRIEADLSYSGNGPDMTKKPVRDRSEYKWPADLGYGRPRYGHVMR
jgi:hypothetical protein